MFLPGEGILELVHALLPQEPQGSSREELQEAAGALPNSTAEPLGELRALAAVNGPEQPHLGHCPLPQPHFSSAVAPLTLSWLMLFPWLLWALLTA